MNILMICEFFDDALDYQENMLARCYHRAGHEVTVIASTIRVLGDYVNDRDRGQGPGTEEHHAWGRLIRVPFRRNIAHRLKWFEPILPIIREVQPDLLYFHDIIPNMSEGVRYVREHPDCAMIMDYHGDHTNSGVNWVSRKILHSVIRRRMLDRARPYLKRILPVTPGSATFLRELYHIPDAEMDLLPLGTDQVLARSVLASGARGQVRSALGIPDGALVVFTGGKLAPYKRTEAVLEAVGDLPGAPIHVILVGTADSAYQNYDERVGALVDQDPRIHRVGWQDRTGIYAHMAAADVAIFPAGQSVLWQQSLGMGLPLIVSERSETLRGTQPVGYLNRHANLIVLDTEEPLRVQIARELQRLNRDCDALQRMSEGASRTAAEILDYDAIAARTLTYCGG
jgi:glycosyltransferase involved in cell wall biosynthesis